LEDRENALQDFELAAICCLGEEKLLADWMLARSLAAIGELKKAESLCKSLLIRDERQSARYYATLASIFLGQKRIQDSIDTATLAIKKRPDLDYSYYIRALANICMGKAEEGLVDLNHAIELAESEFEATRSSCYYNRGCILRVREQRKEALIAFDAARQLSPNDPVVHEQYCLMFALENDPSLIVGMASEFADIHSNSESALRAATVIAQAARSNGLAVKYARMLYALNRSSSFGKYSLFKALLPVDHFEAVELLNELCADDPYDIELLTTRVILHALSQDDRVFDPKLALKFASAFPESGRNAQKFLQAKLCAAIANGDIDESERLFARIANVADSFGPGTVALFSDSIIGDLRAGIAARQSSALLNALHLDYLPLGSP